MAKKNNLPANTEIKKSDNKNDIVMNDSPINKKKPLSELSITELMSLQQACALLCKRYETIAQLDINNNMLFKEYQAYYEMIFVELGKRIVKHCKNEG